VGWLEATVWYCCSALLVVLLLIAARNGNADRYPHRDTPWKGGTNMEVMAYISAWLLVFALVFAGLVDVVVWATKSESPSVSDIIHYHLSLYPFVGWIAAGVCYHLLVDRPQPPWR
jgi:hypothetical protein